MTHSTSIRLDSCAKTFANGAKALDPMSLTIEGGETLIFLGPSGCGKTTTLRIIAGLESPDPGGKVLFDEDDVTALPIEHRNVGMVFQSYALFPNMTVQQNIAYGLKIRKTPAAESKQRVGEMLEMMHIGELRDRRIDQLSGGQRQRVALARAIAVRPKVLLLDEPLTALDALLRERLRVDIDSLLRSLGITTVYVTHDQAEAMSLGDRIVVMDRGKVAQVGTPQEIYFEPQGEFVADFIGTMNRLDGNVVDGVFQTAGGTLPLADKSNGPASVLFRPENARLLPSEQASLSGTISTVFFLGDRNRLIISGISESDITIEAQNSVSFEPGDRIGLAIDSKNLILV
ncbi:ABC transporter ATP-binding protein [Chromatiales bacterium (ex Bugula neritina AB1)]|nr:ABC transporter ATP-binding protein [Chromatiales bacterium (ex Bugula neritina AB1)]